MITARGRGGPWLHAPAAVGAEVAAVAHHAQKVVAVRRHLLRTEDLVEDAEPFAAEVGQGHHRAVAMGTRVIQTPLSVCQ